MTVVTMKCRASLTMERQTLRTTVLRAVVGPLDAKLILAVHDELVVERLEDQAEDLGSTLFLCSGVALGLEDL
jgi:DNA polymerase I-like protein with 3'-5' exonuclease and polymerase domains